MKIKKQISVGVIGYPNVGKSSVINTIISKKSCKVAPVPGETKIWQYITLFKRISLIDCPGVVVDTANDSEVDSVLKGVVRAERLENPEDFIDPILEKVKREHVAAQYSLPKKGDDTWKTTLQLLEMIARRSGRLLKGGEPCLRSAAIMMILDYQRGRLPHYVAPPELKDGEDDGEAKTKKEPTAKIEGVKAIKQDLTEVGEEKMQDDNEDAEDEGQKDSTADEDKKPSATGDVEEVDSDSDEGEQPLPVGEGEWDDED